MLGGPTISYSRISCPLPEIFLSRQLLTLPLSRTLHIPWYSSTCKKFRSEPDWASRNPPLNESYTYHWLQQQPYELPGGSVKIIDTTIFPIAKMFASALVTVKPGAMREMHWHMTITHDISMTQM